VLGFIENRKIKGRQVHQLGCELVVPEGGLLRPLCDGGADAAGAGAANDDVKDRFHCVRLEGWITM
jgi:hypothetical protein